jgi:hypothetical protein
MRLAWVFIILIPITTGCADVMFRYHQSTASAALGAMACKDMLSTGVDKKVAACAAVLSASGSAAGQKCLDDWKGMYGKIDTACKSLKVAAKGALDAAPVVEAAMDKDTEALGWIARLAKLALDVTQALAEAGFVGGQ